MVFPGDGVQRSRSATPANAGSSSVTAALTLSPGNRPPCSGGTLHLPAACLVPTPPRRRVEQRRTARITVYNYAPHHYLWPEKEVLEYGNANT